ncbi:MAG: desulfoferrodoxin FeS4 iron-binding domain-containing protein [Thiovulaceae bacterium]|nr:desulfoferrodoxin FeS4 iron-binding domain-containing protein [Sulfurimonadaceae bacterium]
MKKYESYRCNSCGNVVEVTTAGAGMLSCCDQEMELATDNLTMVNLLKAFAGESMARNKYEYFAKAAQKEGLRDIAAHFQRAADNEKSHAKLEFTLNNVMNGGDPLGDTLENLKIAIAGESYENLTMYPDFAAIAQEEGHKEAARLFKAIQKVEVEHEKMYRALLERLESNEEQLSENEEEQWICEVCGHVHRGKKPPKECPVCKHPQEYFSRLNTRK